MRKSNNNKNEKRDSSAWAIKIGGSLYNSKCLTLWLRTINQYSDRKIIIIPGGGPFANQVRHADEKFNLNEVYSHNMAVMAMQQYGNVLASLQPELVLANSKQKIYQSWADGKVVIWEPYEMVRDQCMLDKTWQVTSDSLALWVSNFLTIDNILLIKSSSQVLEDFNLEKLSRNGCIDNTVLALVNKYQMNLKFLHKSQAMKLAALLSST